MTAPNLPATVSDEYGTGYEDLGDDVAVVPRIQINHKGGTFKDSLSGEEFPEIHGVLLGVVRQRAFWPSEMGENPSKPMCKSNDGITGYPNPEPEKDDGFPWSQSGLNKAAQPVDEHDRITIACETCPFAQWRENPKDPKKNLPPLCKERHTYPILYNRTGTGGYEPPYLDSGILAFQGSGIKPSKMYVAGFKRARKPLYAGVARITLDQFKRGMVEYSVPNIVKVGEVPEDALGLYGQEWPELKEFLTAAPRPDDAGQDPNKGHGQSAAQAARNVGINLSQATVGVAEPVDAEIVEDPPAPAPAARVAAPVTPVVRPTAAPATPAQAVVNAATAAPAAPVVSDDDDELPF